MTHPAEHATATVVAVASRADHRFSKTPQPAIRLLEGLGVEGDAHAGVTVQHRSRVARDPSQPNLRQVHLIHAELLDELVAQGFHVGPGSLGENITTRGIDLLALPAGTRLVFGDGAEVEVTGLRNPCSQIEDYEAGLLAAVVARVSDVRVQRKTGVMGIVRAGGIVRPGDRIRVELPAVPFQPLVVV
jgi:MOSC domain-containing protein YiiM